MKPRVTAIAAALCFLAINMFAPAGSAQADTSPNQCGLDRQAAVNEQLKKIPGGQVIDERTISYASGKVTVTLANPASCGGDGASAKSDCTEDWLCLWSSSRYLGTKWSFTDNGYWQDLRQWGITSFSSFYNHRADAFLLKQHSSAPSYCYDYETAASDVAATVGSYRFIYLRETSGC
ncbi:hypothetical protein ABT340_06850 [Streptosporangium sp. NPDC000239]|uniref:hypothetical protein n=1 Tax=Streptosporangium sp. NPDC000239 TaxID=3154248 RepID=UPI00331A31F5